VTVARELTSVPDAVASMGVMLARQAAATTVAACGDGTTTAILLTAEIARHAARAVAAGAAPVRVRAGIEKAASAALNAIKGMSRPADTLALLERIATQAANGDCEIGALIAEALDTVGNTGTINISDTLRDRMEVEYQNGFVWEQGFATPGLQPPAGTSVTLENPLVFLASMTLSGLYDILGAMSLASQEKKPLLIVAEGLQGDALSTVVTNNHRGTLQCQWVKPPSFGSNRFNILEDIALLTGAEVLCHDKGSDPASVRREQLGSASSCTIEQFQTLLQVPDSAAASERATMLRGQAETTENEFDREKLLERAARLTSGVATIRVGAGSEAAAKERRDRVDDALRAAVAAFKGGILPGGGIAMLAASRTLDDINSEDWDESEGISAVKRALEMPTWQLAANTATIRPDFVVGYLNHLNSLVMGVDSRTGKFVNMLQEGIIDPTLVMETALRQAASIAGLLITTEVAITHTYEGHDARYRTNGRTEHRAAP